MRTVLLVLAFLAAAGVPARAAEPQLADLDREIAIAGLRLGVIVEQYNAAHEDLASTRARVRALEARIRPLAAEVRTSRKRVDGIAARAYRTGDLGVLQALLTADSPGGLADRLTTLDAIARSQQRDVATLVDLGGRLDRQRRGLADLQRRQAEQARVLGDVLGQVQRQIGQLQALRSRARAMGGSVPPSLDKPVLPIDVKLSVSTSDPGLKAVTFAYGQLGKPYRFGAAGPDAFDCSGLTMAAWQAAGVQLPHHSGRQYDAIPHVQRADLRPGDLVFYYPDRHHVAIYVGDGKVIDAPQQGELVTVHPLDLAPISGYGRPG